MRPASGCSESRRSRRSKVVLPQPERTRSRAKNFALIDIKRQLLDRGATARTACAPGLRCAAATRSRRIGPRRKGALGETAFRKPARGRLAFRHSPCRLDSLHPCPNLAARPNAARRYEMPADQGLAHVRNRGNCGDDGGAAKIFPRRNCAAQFTNSMGVVLEGTSSMPSVISLRGFGP